MIKLIINADDFGYSKVFNEKILELLENDFIKSTTVMVNWIKKDQDSQVIRLIKLIKNQKVSTGLHLEIDMTKDPLPQIEQQYGKFLQIFGSAPSHLDIHKTTDDVKLLKMICSFAEKKNLPVRNHGIKAKTKQTDYPALHLESLKRAIGDLKDGKSYEIITHPGEYDPDSKSALNREREIDYEEIVKLQDSLKSRKDIRIISYLEL